MRRAVAVAVLLAVAAVVLAVVLVSGRNGPVDSVADLDRGDCVDAPGYLAGATTTPEHLARVDCDDAHDGEVLVRIEMDAGDARAYRDEVPNPVCADHLGIDDSAAVSDQTLLLAGVVDDQDAAAGDPMACLAFKADGTRLDGRVRPR